MSRIILAGALLLVGASGVVASKSDEIDVIRPSVVDRPALSFDDEGVEAQLTEIWTAYVSQIEAQNAEIEEEITRSRAVAQKKGDLEEVNLWGERQEQWEATGRIKYEPKAQADPFGKFLHERTVKYGKAGETLEKNYKSLVAKVLKNGKEAWAKELDQRFRDDIAPKLPPPLAVSRPPLPIPGLLNGRYVTQYPGGWTLELQVNGDTAKVLRSGFNGNLQPPPEPMSGVFKRTATLTYAIDLGPWREVWEIHPRSRGRDIQIQHWAGGVDRYGPPTHKAVADRVGN